MHEWKAALEYRIKIHTALCSRVSPVLPRLCRPYESLLHSARIKYRQNIALPCPASDRARYFNFYVAHRT